ncbi:hypothetical protein Tco_1083311, partial [Tanacetum coccineum]
MVFNSPCLTDKKELIHHEGTALCHSTGKCLKYQLVEIVCNLPWEQPFLGPKDCLAHNKFSPQWRFLVHTILHCLSTKSGSWDQFGSSLAVALICLSDGRKFNWSSYIFKGMVSNIGNAKKFLMYPRFLQTILGIETSFTRQYRVFKLSSKLFANMLPQDQEGEGAGVAAQAVPPPIPEPIPEPMPEPDQPQDHLSTPPRQQTPPASPPRSTQAPPAGHTSGGAEDLITLTDVSSVVSTLVQKVNSLETELKDTKKLFKDVVGKLVKKVKAYLKNRLTKPKSILKGLDLDADDKTFIKFVSDEDSTNEAPSLWFALAGWEVISTPLGEINALYRLDQSTK